MRRTKVLGATLVAVGAMVSAGPARAQATVGADLGVFSSYVWRGLSLTNKPVAQPDLYLTFPAGNASITVGGWANVDLGNYNDTEDISESGGNGSFNFAEFDPWAEISYTVGVATITGGALGYIYPNDFGLTSDANTVEIYGKLAIEAPLSPKLTVYYDVDKIKGAYLEGSVSHTLPVSERLGVALGALAGLSAGQGVNDDPNSDESSNFADNGFTHLDLSAGVPIAAGALSITPALHFVVNGDDATKITKRISVDPLTGEPTFNSKDVKLWGGVTISWSKALGEEPEEEAPASPE